MLLEKACNALILSVEHFNRPWDQGRAEAVLIFLDHSFEMLMKSAILHRGGKIFDKGARHTIGFNACVRRSLSDASIKYLTQEQALLLQSINNLRDAAQHHLLDVSEQHLYIQAQAGITMFRDLLRDVFNKELRDEMPSRVLPVSTKPPTDLTSLFDNEIKEIRNLLKPGKRRTAEGEAKLRALAIMDGAILGESDQPTPKRLKKLRGDIRAGRPWTDLFPGVASINITSSGQGPSLEFRLSKKEGIPVHLVKEGTPGASVVAVKTVNELGFYNLGRNQLAEKLKIGQNKTSALIWKLGLKGNDDYYREIKIGKSSFHRYSQKALSKMRESLKTISIDEVWKEYREWQSNTRCKAK